MGVQVAVIPVAGKGTRLLPLTRSVPKELLPLGRKPVLQHVVEEMQAAGVNDLVMITSACKDAIKQHLSPYKSIDTQLKVQGPQDPQDPDNLMSGDTVCRYVEQEQQLGLGHAVLCAREAVADRPFFVALGDARMGDTTDSDGGNLSGCAYTENSASLSRRMLSQFEDSGADVAISFQQVPIEAVSRYGIASIQPGYAEGDEMFTLSGLVEKPAPQNAPSQFAVAARYLCKPVIFDYLERTRPGHGGEIQLTDAIQSLIEDGGHAIGVPLQAQEKRFDVGNFESYFAAFIEVALRDPDCGESLKKKLAELLK